MITSEVFDRETALYASLCSKTNDVYREGQWLAIFEPNDIIKVLWPKE